MPYHLKNIILIKFLSQLPHKANDKNTKKIIIEFYKQYKLINKMSLP
jgi:hypothetical protein